MKKTFLICLALLSVIMILSAPAAMASSPDVGDMVKFVPYQFTATSSKVVVEGYFVNMNTNYAVKNFKNFVMKVYEDGDLLLSADFGTLSSFTINPLQMKKFTFTYNCKNGHDMKLGTYPASDRDYCVITMNFTSSER